MNITIEVKNQDESSDNKTVTAKFSIPFFDFEKSKKEAQIFFENFCKVNKNYDKNLLKQLASEKLINDYSKKTSNIGFGLCLFSVVPLIEAVLSFGSIPVELAILTRYNMHLMVKLAVINEYPFTDDDFVDTLIISAKNHDTGATSTRFFLRFIGTIPIIGQLFTATIGASLCAHINKQETLNFGRNILKEYNLDYEIKENTFNVFSLIKKILLLVVIILLLCYTYFNVHNESKLLPEKNKDISTPIESVKTNNFLAKSLNTITIKTNRLIEKFENNFKINSK